MTDHSNNNTETHATSHAHLQDKLIKDSITNNQSITAQVKACQSHVCLDSFSQIQFDNAYRIFHL